MISRQLLVYRQVTYVASLSHVLTPSKAYTKMKGSLGYTLNFDTVELRVERIEHNNESTGTMKLVLWAIDNFTGRTDWSGVRVAEVRLEQCAKNEYYSNIRRTVSRRSPSPGSYTMILALEACINKRFVMEDYLVFDNRKTFQLDVKMKGSRGYTIKKNEVNIRVEKITHNSSGRTGTLKLRLWVSDNGKENGRWSGYVLAKCKLEPLESGYSYKNINRTCSRRHVPSGSYRILLQVLSYNSGWTSQESFEFDGYETL